MGSISLLDTLLVLKEIDVGQFHSIFNLDHDNNAIVMNLQVLV